METKTNLIKIETDNALEYLISFSRKGDATTTTDIEKARKFTDIGSRQMRTKIRSHGIFCVAICDGGS